ncbi:MAG: TonB-dependent receptor [Chitinophagaceae bacterium]|nr:TonB-dependent receptor [Chitinophagaceae bacterium]
MANNFNFRFLKPRLRLCLSAKSFNLLLFFQLFYFGAFCQTTITGKVTASNGDPLPDVSVMINGSSVGTITDQQGNYSISILKPKDILIFSFTGFKNQEIMVSGRTVIDIALQENPGSLRDVVIIGYGTQSRRSVTTAISKLDNKVLENIPYANVTSALQGTIPGVRVQSTTGQPGATPVVIVRGGTSINNPDGATPLYVVDGVNRPDLSNINADDISSIQVLKDAAATAIYGSRASNGVVLVTTKSGKSGSLSISYSGNVTASDVWKKYDLVSAKDLIKFFRLGVQTSSINYPDWTNYNTSAAQGGTGNDLTKNTPYTTMYLTDENRYKLNEGWQSMPDPLDPSKTIIFDEIDWQDVIYQTGISHNHYLSASGGTEKATFRVGAGYLDNTGVAIFTSYKRASLDLSGDLKVSNNLRFFSRVNYANSSTRGGNWPYTRPQLSAPTMKYKFEDGSLAYGDDDFLNPEYNQGARQANRNIRDNLTLILGTHWEILPGLSFDPQISLYQIFNYQRAFTEALWESVTQFNNSRPASGSYTNYLQKQADATFTYKNNINNRHNIVAVAGYSLYQRKNTLLSASGQRASTDLIPTLNASATPVSVGGSESDQTIMGYFGRINYDYEQKYLLSVSSRYDGASNLGAAHKWGYFPGISLGWNLDRENFWRNLTDDQIQLKLRGSYGITGNISGLGDYQAQGQYAVGALYNGNASILNTVLANQDLKWEKSKTLDLGVELGALGGRLTFIFDYYRRVTDQLLTNLALPQSTGFSSVFTNLGTLQNKGLEINLNLQVLSNASPFQWNVSFNAARNKNKILKLPDNGTKNNRVGGFYVWDDKSGGYAWKGGLQEGGSIGEMYGFKQMRIYATDAEAANAPLDLMLTKNNSQKYGGDVEWLDADKNDTIDTRDQVYVGNIYPVWTGGFTSSFSYKNLSLSIRLDYTGGHTIYDWSNAFALGFYGSFNTLTKDALRSWQKQGDVTDIPRIWYQDQDNQKNFSRTQASLNSGNSRFYEKGDYISIREVSLSYNIPQSLLQKIRVSSLRFYLTGSNLWYFTRYDGLNAEIGGQQRGPYPTPRNITFGLNVSL